MTKLPVAVQVYSVRDSAEKNLADTLKKIKEKIFSYGQEYYVEYTSRDDLRYLFFKDMVSYFV